MSLAVALAAVALALVTTPVAIAMTVKWANEKNARKNAERATLYQAQKAKDLLGARGNLENVIAEKDDRYDELYAKYEQVVAKLQDADPDAAASHVVDDFNRMFSGEDGVHDA